MTCQNPLRTAPSTGAEYWVVDLTEGYQEEDLLRNGICHLTKEAAELHAKALISLTATKEEI